MSQTVNINTVPKAQINTLLIGVQAKLSHLRGDVLAMVSELYNLRELSAQSDALLRQAGVTVGQSGLDQDMLSDGGDRQRLSEACLALTEISETVARICTMAPLGATVNEAVNSAH